MNYKDTDAAETTITRDLAELGEQTNNIYEAIVIVSKRANQIGVKMKDELNSKLAEFATTTDNLDEVFENREQIEISKFYESLPKPNALSMAELLKGETYFRRPEQEEEA